MPPVLIASTAIALIALQGELEAHWRHPYDVPMVISRTGLIGQIFLLATRLSVIVAGLSLIVWSFINLPWYLPIVLLIAIPAVVRTVSRPDAIRMWVTSALTPLVTATGLIALHWLTWFA